jgi:hypothetical protein
LDPGLLRKGRQDAKDEPGAADFYYGEMEMRRHARGSASNRRRASSRGRVERGILTAYWLVSGYGLRAWRALAGLPGCEHHHHPTGRKTDHQLAWYRR